MILNRESRDRYAAFWAHDFVDRAVLYLHARTGNRRGPEPTDVRAQWEDVEYRLASYDVQLSNTTWYADGFPSFWPNLGPGVLAAMLGGEFDYAPDTVWFGENKIFNFLNDANLLLLTQDSRMNRLVGELTLKAGHASNGRYITGMTDIGGTLDVLASFRSTQKLLTDLYDNPEGVRHAREIIDGLWQQAFEESYEIIKNMNDGVMTAWIPIWCEKRWYPLQSDFCAMISPEHFTRFVLPSVRLQARYLDHSVYHLDGVGEIPHLDDLLETEELDGIQWVPGAGKPNSAAECWLNLYRRIQSAGKNLVVTDNLTADEVIFLLKNLSPKGLFIATGVENREAAAKIEDAAFACASRYK